MKILILCPYPILPAWSGGKIRALEIARELARLGLGVTLATPFKPGQRAHAGLAPQVEIRQLPYPFLAPWLLTDKPFPYGHLVSLHPGLRYLAARLVAGHDLVQLEHAWWADLTRALDPVVPVVYHAHNVEYDYLRSECRSDAVRSRVGRRARALEGRLVARAALIVTCAPADAQRMRQLYGADQRKLLVAPHGIRAVSRPRGGEREALLRRLPRLRAFRNLAVFSGSNVEHNRVAARWILDCLAPRLRGTCGFVLHGVIAARYRHHVAENVFFDDAFEDFQSYAHTGIVGLNPVTQGSGSNLKVLHYLAHGLPVLSTDFGLRGYEDLRPHVSVRPLEEFPAVLESGLQPCGAPAPALERYLWRKVAAGIGDAYADLVTAGA